MRFVLFFYDVSKRAVQKYSPEIVVKKENEDREKDGSSYFNSKETLTVAETTFSLVERSYVP